jgi:N-acetylglucosamine-6-phosphate deacetylase
MAQGEITGMATIQIRNGRVLADGQLHKGWVVAIEDGKIGYVGPEKKGSKAAETIDAAGLAVVPGFIDLHIHGGAGSDFMDATLQDYCTIAGYHAAGGTTAWMPTTATDRHENVLAALKTIRQAREQKLDGPAILGAHVEGPYLTLSKCGCHDSDLVRPPRDNETRDYLDNADVIGRITIAPDLPGAMGFIRQISGQGVLVSGGHSEATYSVMMEAIDAGMRMVTHLYSAMSSILKAGPFRSGGMLEATMLDDRLSTELIADGKHVPVELLKLALKAKDANTVCFTTDAMRGAGAPDGVYTFGGKGGTKAIVENGVARNLLNTGFASSTVQMVDLVRNGVQLAGLDLAESVRRCSEVPARIAGVFDRKGSLEAGKDADVVLLDDAAWRVRRTIVGGKG